MKEAIISLGLIVVFLYGMLLDLDVDTYKSHRKTLKGVAEETAASAAQYFRTDSFGEGYYNFIQPIGTEAAHVTLRNSLRLDNTNNPLPNAYWKERVQMQLTFIDYDNAATFKSSNAIAGQTFPNYFEFNHFGKKQEIYLFGPSVISTINAGNPNYALAFFEDLSTPVLESGVHTLRE